MTVDLSPGQQSKTRQPDDAMPGGPAPPSFLIRDILSEPPGTAAAAAAAAAAAGLAAAGIPFGHHPLHHPLAHHLPRALSPADSYSRQSDRDDGQGAFAWKFSPRRAKARVDVEACLGASTFLEEGHHN